MRTFILFIFSTLMLFIAPLKAHEVRPAIADLMIEDTRVSLLFFAPVEPWLTGMNLAALENTNDSPLAGLHDRYREMTPEQLQAEFEARWPELRKNISLKTPSTELTLDLVAVSIPEQPDLELPRDATMLLSANITQQDLPLTLQLTPQMGALALRYKTDTESFGELLTPGSLSSPLPFTEQSAWDTAKTYLISGFDHILPKGLDHILFVLGLFFFATGWRPLLWQVSVFTLAHTITLAMATLGVISAPASIVEPLIALSIFYVAVENIFGKGILSPLRLAVIFGFGLLHGLGFASVLGDFGLEQGHFIVSLIAFNVGVELGQITVLLLAWLAVGLWFHKKAWYKTRISNPASVGIGLIGLYWTIERVFF